MVVNNVDAFHGADAAAAAHGVLFDLLMAVMNSVAVWQEAAPDAATGLQWRDTVTARMSTAGRYTDYERLVTDAATAQGLPPTTADRLFEAWSRMEPWPDAAVVVDCPVPYAFVTNCSARLAESAARASGLEPTFVLSAERSGWFKPAPEAYQEACRLLGTAPNRTLFVAGSPYDAEGARRAGLGSILVRRRSDHRPINASTSVVESLAELPWLERPPHGAAGP